MVPVLIFLLVSENLLARQTDKWSEIVEDVEKHISSGLLNEAKVLSENHMDEASVLGIDSIVAKFHFAIALGYYRSDTERGMLYLDSSIFLSKSKSLHSMYLRALNAKSTFLKRLGRFEESKAISYQVYRHAIDNSPNNVFQSARNLSVIYRQLGKYDSALHYIFIADSLAKGSPDHYLKYLTVQGAANIYKEMKKYRLAISRNQMLLTLSKKDVDRMYTWLNLGLSYTGLELLDSAKISFRNSLEYAEIVGDTIELANLYGLLAEIDYQQEEYKLALINIQKSLFYSDFDKPGDIISSSNLTLAKISLAQGELKKAVEAAEAALQLSRDMSLATKEISALGVLSEALSKSGEYFKAYETMSAYEKLKSEFNDKDRMAKIEELQTRYETDKKVQEINALTKENQIKGLQIDRQKIIIAGSVVLALLVISLAFVLYRQFKLRSSQRQLVLEQSLLRTQMNPHFIFNALSSIQNFVLDNDGNKASLYLAKFGELMRDILEASRLEVIPLSKELRMVTNYVDLEQARFSKDLKVSIETNNLEIEDIMVPPMMIQPFVENSIKHGFSEKESGTIFLKISSEQNQLKIILEDDGKGLSENFTIDKKSLAIKITQERLSKFQNSSDKSINISNRVLEDGKVLGLSVTLKLPLEYAI